MPTAVPILVCSHTVRGTCTIGFTRTNGVADTFTLPEGLYWPDPVYFASVSLAYSLQGKVGALMNVEEGGTVWTIQPTGPHGLVEWTESAGGALAAITPATCNAEGRRVLQRLGLSPSTASAISGTFSGGFPHGIWSPDWGGLYTRRERTFSVPERRRERGGTLVGFSGRAWPATIGANERRRTIQLSTLDRRLVRNELGTINVGTEGDDADGTLETLFWRWASRGELVRVYSDSTATKTYVTAAVTAAATSISVQSGTGLADDEVIWVDGEQMLIVSGGGTTTLTVERPDAEAHPAGSPVSDAHVATYCLDMDGGNVTLLDFAPERRSASSPFYDVSIALVRATWDG